MLASDDSCYIVGRRAAHVAARQREEDRAAALPTTEWDLAGAFGYHLDKNGFMVDQQKIMDDYAKANELEVLFDKGEYLRKQVAETFLYTDQLLAACVFWFDDVSEALPPTKRPAFRQININPHIEGFTAARYKIDLDPALAVSEKSSKS